jgi:uncharacterized protein
VVRSLEASEKDRNRRYDLADPFLEFWYRFVLPHRSALEAGHALAVWQNLIAPHLNEYMGLAFEHICREFMRLYAQEVLGVPMLEVGRIFAANFDLDVAGISINRASVYGECKWWKDPVGENILEHLLQTSSQSPYGSVNETTQYFVFSKKGFTPSLRARAKTTANLHLIAPEQLLGRVKRSSKKPTRQRSPQGRKG